MLHDKSDQYYNYEAYHKSGIKVIRNNFNKGIAKPVSIYNTLEVCCENCNSELEITEADTHVGWLGSRYITCPCCGEESTVEELEPVTLTKDTLKFPEHFLRTNKTVRSVKEISSIEVNEAIDKAIDYFRENKTEWAWYTSFGDMFLVVFRFDGDEEYSIFVTKDFYEASLPFEKADYK